MYFDRKKLRALRESQNISQEQLAIKVGTSNRNYYRWEAGTAIPSLSQYFFLREYFGKDIYTLEDPNSEPEQEQPAQ